MQKQSIKLVYQVDLLIAELSVEHEALTHNLNFTVDNIPLGLLIAADTCADEVSGRGLDGVGRSLSIFWTAYELAVSRHLIFPAGVRDFSSKNFE